MSVKRINEYLPRAITVLRDCGIEKDGKIIKTYRSQISSFGAAVRMGTLASAVAFYSKAATTGANAGGGEGKVDRSLLMNAIYMLIGQNGQGSLLNAVVSRLPGFDKENILDAAAALKLGMNAYQLIDPTSSGGREADEQQ